MIVFPAFLAVLAAQSTSSQTPASAPALFRAYAIAHPVITCDIDLIGPTPGSVQGRGRFTIDNKRHVIFWKVTYGGSIYTYTNNGRRSLELWPKEKLYDIMPVGRAPIPPARRFSGQVPYPIMLALGGVVDPFSLVKPLPKSRAGELDFEAKVVSPTGSFMARLKLAPDGRLLSSMSDSLDGKNETGIVYKNYTYSVPSGTSFKVDPPLGYDDYGFRLAADALQTGDAAPKVALRGAKGVAPFSKLVGSQTVLVGFFAAKPSPAMILAFLKAGEGHRLLAVGPTTMEIGHGVKTFKASEQALNELGVGGYPVFYLFKQGKLDQGWRGFDPSASATWVQSVHDAVAGKHSSQE